VIGQKTANLLVAVE